MRWRNNFERGPGVTSTATAVPAAPTALAATAGNQQISLTWTASSGATSYHVKRATVSGGPYTQVGSPAVTSYTDTGLTNGTSYFYVVSAVNASGESANSSQASGTPASSSPASSVPAAPTALAATPGNQQISLTWTRQQRRDQLSREAGNGQRWTLYPGGCARKQRLHQHRPDQWHAIFLCCIGAECGRRKRELEPGQRDPFRGGARCDRHGRSQPDPSPSRPGSTDLTSIPASQAHRRISPWTAPAAIAGRRTTGKPTPPTRAATISTKTTTS